MPPARLVHAALELDVVARTEFVLAVAVADRVPRIEESFRAELDGAPIDAEIVLDAHGTRLHRFSTGAGTLRVDYDARVAEGRPIAVEPLDAIRYLRPSRYAEADTLTPFARAEFPGLAGAELVRAVGDWVHGRLRYAPGEGVWRGGAEQTLEAGHGVCRDFAHVVVALLRALDVPARLVAVYAPDLRPMDFHAVAEALVDGRWVVVDATRLAPRRGMVRIATGRDAADTAFVTNTLADVELRRLEVDARVDGGIASDDPAELVELR